MVNRELTETKTTAVQPAPASAPARIPVLLVVLLFASAVYFACIVSPPSLMDDVDAVQAQISRNMLTSGDWVTARLDGIPYLEKAPLIYWLIALAFRVFGPYDWAARIVIALSSVALCLITAAFGRWAFGRRAGLYAGLCMSTCVGLFLFTRILIPDVLLVAAIALSLWAFLRALDAEERHPAAWAALFAGCMGVGLLLKSLIGVVFPLGAAAVYLLVTSQLFARRTWRRLHPVSGLLIILAIALPWHVIAMLRNPPLFDFTHAQRAGRVSRLLLVLLLQRAPAALSEPALSARLQHRSPGGFWLLHLVWLFPWAATCRLSWRRSFRPVDRAGRTRLLALCLTGLVLIFFSFLHHPGVLFDAVYPALALLSARPWRRRQMGGSRRAAVA